MTASILGPAGPAGAYTSVTGRVDKVLDGDTFWIDVPNDGKGRFLVRVAGINTMEHNVDVSRCHGGKAYAVTKGLIGGKRVTIRSYRGDSTGSKDRSLRFVEIPDGRDLGTVLLKRGLAWAYPSDVEPRKNVAYIGLARAAARQNLEIWDDDDCGSGPQQSAQLRMQLRWDAEDNDDRYLKAPLPSREWVRIFNDGASPVYLSRDGWLLRETSSFYFHFKGRGAVVQPGSYITVYGGPGDDNAARGRFFWDNTRRSLFGDERLNNGQVNGDGAYLIDRHNDIRVYTEYPCMGSSQCTAPLSGKVKVSANWDAEGNNNDLANNPNGEWVNVRNSSAAAINLKDYFVEKWPYSYVFVQNTVLQPGERLRLYVGKGTDSALRKFWGKDSEILQTGQDVKLRRLANATPAKTDWPRVAHVQRIPCNTSGCRSPGVSMVDNGTGTARTLTIRNRSGKMLNLRDWLVQIGRQQYDFKFERIVADGANLVIAQGNAADTATTVYWDPAKYAGWDGGIALDNANHKAFLYNTVRATVDCTAWGSEGCG